MFKLNRMLLRDIKNAKGQFIAAAAVIFAGIAIFAASFMSYRNLKNSIDYYYRVSRFLDYYAEAQYISDEAVRRIRQLPGVADAIGRVVVDVGGEMGEGKRVTVRIISVPDDQPPRINRFFFNSGSYPESGDDYGCLVSRRFAEYYKLRRGDPVKTIINRKIQVFTVRGIVDSPEYLYEIKSAAEIMTSSPENFGVIYVKESIARTILDYENIYNQVHVRFYEGVAQPPLIDAIESRLKAYGFIMGVERKDQLSYTMIKSEIKQLETMAIIFPALFLTVAALIIYIMLRRVVNNQRTLIGVMKAIGYTNRRILFHYTGYAGLIALAGAIPGVLAGLWMGQGMTSMYTAVYNLPLLEIKVYWDIILSGVLISASFCLLAGFNAAKRVLAIEPAEAMRPEAPKMGKTIILERIGWLWRGLNFSWKMSLRNIFRSRQRTLLTILGTCFSIMFFFVTFFFLDAMDFLIKETFYEFQRQDYKVGFVKPVSYQDAIDLVSLRGVRRAEPLLEVPAQLEKDWMKRGTMLVGLTPQNSMYRLAGPDRRRLEVPHSGMLVSDYLMKQMRLKVGDRITVTPFVGNGKTKEVLITGVVKEYAGFNCYLNLAELGELLEEGRFATGALLTIEPGADRIIKAQLNEIPGVSITESRLGALVEFEKYMYLMYLYIGIMILLGSLMGFAIVFNTTIINIMARNRELASLKVLGYGNREIERTLFRENIFLGIIALAPGTALGILMCHLFAMAFTTEFFTFEVVLYPSSYLITYICVFGFIFLAQWATRGRIKRLDMVEVLKTQEG